MDVPVGGEHLPVAHETGRLFGSCGRRAGVARANYVTCEARLLVAGTMKDVPPEIRRLFLIKTQPRYRPIENGSTRFLYDPVLVDPPQIPAP